jgi:hypothetical protein
MKPEDVDTVFRLFVAIIIVFGLAVESTIDEVERRWGPKP